MREEFFGKTRDCFRDYYSKLQKPLPNQSLFVLEKFAFVKKNFKIDLENDRMRRFEVSVVLIMRLEISRNSILLKRKLKTKEKNLDFVKRSIVEILIPFGIIMLHLLVNLGVLCCEEKKEFGK
jgi:hypothetical protein